MLIIYVVGNAYTIIIYVVGNAYTLTMYVEGNAYTKIIYVVRNAYTLIMYVGAGHEDAAFRDRDCVRHPCVKNKVIGYRGTSLMRNIPSVEPYSSPMPRDLWWS